MRALAIILCASVCAAGTNLVDNGSFEEFRTGTYGMPAQWNVRPWARGDRADLISNAGLARSGLRYMRLVSPSGRGIKLDALPQDAGLELQPGRTYTIGLWARRERGASKARLSVEPGRFSKELGGSWQRYSFAYSHPADAKPLLGLSLRVSGGPVAVDDVSMVAEGEAPAWPDELKADRVRLARLPVDWSWRAAGGGPEWSRRVPVTVAEVMGREARSHLIRLSLADLLPELTYEGISPATIVVVDAGGPAQPGVPCSLLDFDPRIEGVSPHDQICFLADVPPRSAKTYFVYVAQDRKAGLTEPLPKELPRRLAAPSGYPYKLDIDIGSLQQRIDVSCRMVGAGLSADIHAWSGQPLAAELASPDGKTVLTVPIENTDPQRRLWQVAKGFRMPSDPPGIWQLSIATMGGPGRAEHATAAVVVGSAIWALPLVEKVIPGDPVRYGCDRPRLAAARNQAESFQVFIETTVELKDVALDASAFVSRGGKASIPAANVTFRFVDLIYNPLPSFEGTGGLARGLYPDPLLPWGRRDVKAGHRTFGLVTVRVPESASPGEYRATITAASAGGESFALPVQLEVFNFALPDKLAFEPVFWADNFPGAPAKGGVVPPGRQELYTRHNPDGAVLELARIMARHHGTSFYAHHDKSPYPVVWHWDREAGTAEFDFAWLDRNGKVVLEDYGQAYLCFGGKFRPHGTSKGAAWDWNRDLEKAWTGDAERALQGSLASLGTDEGKRMYRAYCEGIAGHLKKRGWLDRSYVYVCDETDRGVPSETTEWCARTAREAGLKTFAASLAWGWPVYMSEIDAFTGIVSAASLQRIRKEGRHWWGAYNRPCSVELPLANTRLVGPDSWFKGVSHYCTYLWFIRDGWIDGRYLSPVGANAGYPYGEFAGGVGGDYSWGAWVYAFPAWELKGVPDPPLYVPSLRLEALRQGVEDYEYLRLLAQEGKGYAAEDLLSRMKAFLKDGATNDRTMHGKDVFYVLDGEEYYELRRRIGRAISAGGIGQHPLP